jgi:hypothetical protein
MGAWGSPRSRGFRLPDAPPIPIAQSFSNPASTGSITFDQPLDQTVPLDPADWQHLTSSQHRLVTSIAYSDDYTVSISAMSTATTPGGATGWQYSIGDNPIRGLTGVEVAAFTGFTG